jgi:hypothetical protein
MSYQKKNIQKKNSSSSSVSETVGLRNAFSFPAVPALQRQGVEEELQMKKIPAQLMEEEEPIQGKFGTLQKVEQEEEPIQGKFNTIQKVEEEEPIQGKFDSKQKSAVQLKEISSGNEPINPVQRQEVSEKSNKTGLPDNLKTGVESLSGYSMDDVKVHFNSSKPAQLKAYAYAQGTDIHIAPGQEKYLPHEAWHVAQQKQGRVQPTLQMKTGVAVNDDAGLENEADVMGAKAANLSKSDQLNSTFQLKEDQSSVAQLTPEEDAAFATKYGGIIGMVKNATAVLSDNVWEQIKDNKTDNLSLGTAITGAAGGVTTAAGKLTGKIGSDGIAKAAGDITAGIGSSITSLVKSVMAIKKAYDTASGEGSALVGTSEVAIAVLSALQAGSQAASSIMSYLSSTVPPEITRMIPGLGIAISACQVIKECYTNYIAEQAEAEMTILANDFGSELRSVLGKNPLEMPKLFATESRGKATFIFWGKTDYVRLKPGIFEELNTPLGPKGKDIFASKYGINRAQVDIDKLIPAIQNYEFASKMQEINEKRRVHSSRNVFTGLISLIGSITATFPADGGISASVLLGTASAIEGANSAAKAIQGLARDGYISGGDSDRSTQAKHHEYVNHTKTLYKYLQSISEPITKENSETKVDTAEKMLKSTGANLGTVYALNGSFADQVKHIVESMKTGR